MSSQWVSLSNIATDSAIRLEAHIKKDTGPVTKPVVTLLVRRPLFSTSRYSGLSAKALGTTIEAVAGPAPRARLAKRSDGTSEKDPNVSGDAAPGTDRNKAAADREGS